LLRTPCACHSVNIDVDLHHRPTSSGNCSRVDSTSGERVATLSLRCHGNDDVIRVTSLCAGYLRRSRDCRGCCMDELRDCRVPVESTHHAVMSLTATCDGHHSCNVQLYQPAVRHCSVTHAVIGSETVSEYVVVIYRCSPPVTAGLYAFHFTSWRRGVVVTASDL